jgi:hypothetical protein
VDARTIAVATACLGWLVDVIGLTVRGAEVSPVLWGALPAAITAVLVPFAGEQGYVGRRRASPKGGA